MKWEGVPSQFPSQSLDLRIWSNQQVYCQNNLVQTLNYFYCLSYHYFCLEITGLSLSDCFLQQLNNQCSMKPSVFLTYFQNNLNKRLNDKIFIHVFKEDNLITVLTIHSLLNIWHIPVSNNQSCVCVQKKINYFKKLYSITEKSFNRI